MLTLLNTPQCTRPRTLRQAAIIGRNAEGFEEDPIDLTGPDISGAELASLALRRLHVKARPRKISTGEGGNTCSCELINS